MTTSLPRGLEPVLSTCEIDVVASCGIEEVDEALQVIHDGFVEAGYMAPQPSGRRMHASYLNPGTLFFVARMEGRPVAACALIADGPFGLPSDRAFAEENDAMRSASPQMLRECGSLAVRGEARCHTRRILMRINAAMCRVAIDEFPDAPIPMAVAPQNVRFYSSAVDAETVAGPRPLYGPPAILLRTDGRRIAAHLARRATSVQRLMDDLVTEPGASWFTRRDAVPPLPDGFLQLLLEEQGIAQRLAAQAALLPSDDGAPLAAATDRVSAVIAA